MTNTALLTADFSQPVAFASYEEADMFDLAPISLWAEDYSELKQLFEQWRQEGVTDLQAFLQGDPSRVQRGARAIRVLKVNRRTLSLFGAADLPELIDNRDKIQREDLLPAFIEQMVQFWNGQASFTCKTVNYSLSGRRIDIRLNGMILPNHELDWSRVLVSIEDITAEETARHQLVLRETYLWALFDNSPIPLADCDFSHVKQFVDHWRAAGVADLPAFLKAEPQQLHAAYGTPPTRRANRRALALFEAADLPDLRANAAQIGLGGLFVSIVVAMYRLPPNGDRFVTGCEAFTSSGRRLDLKVNGTILPGAELDWSHVLVALEDVTLEQRARRQLVDAEAYARALFEDLPTLLWVEDYSAVKKRLDELRGQGITDFRTFADTHPEFVKLCLSEVKVLDVNQQTLSVYGAPDKASLLRRLDDVIQDILPQFAEQLIDLWYGDLRHEREIINYTLNGETLNLVQQFSVMQGHEDDWSLVLLALTDITARKKAEAYLEYLHSHDVLTGIYNRSFYESEVSQLRRKGPFPITVIVFDLNGLKIVNDTLGHAAGDILIQRAGDVLSQAADELSYAIRIGGDEFVILMPGTSAAEAKMVLEKIDKLTELNNRSHPAGSTLNFSWGYATCEAGYLLEATIKEADRRMYEAKQKYYETTTGAERRR